MATTPYERLDASDPIDQASDLEQMHLRIALQNQQNNRTVLLPKLAEVTDKKTQQIKIACLCHYCDELLSYVDSTESAHLHTLPRFCDDACRDDWQKEQEMLIRTGKIKGDIRSIPGLKGRVED